MPTSSPTPVLADPANSAPPVVAASSPSDDLAGAPIVPGAALLTCTACGGANAIDSRFCRHCGATLRAGDPAPPAPPAARVPATPVAAAPAPPVAASSNGDAPVARPVTPAVTPAPVPAPPAPAPVDSGLLTSTGSLPGSGLLDGADGQGGGESAEDVDRRRARHLVERAGRLRERGEMAAAILACRQAISLSPQLVSAYAMVGSLLERSGDLTGAIEAYERTVALWPDSPLERERLSVLRAGIAQSGASPLFHFDDSELFPTAPVEVEPTTRPGLFGKVAPPPSVTPSGPTASSGPLPVPPVFSGQNIPPSDAPVTVQNTAPASAPVVAADAAAATAVVVAPAAGSVLTPARVPVPGAAVPGLVAPGNATAPAVPVNPLAPGPRPSVGVPPMMGSVMVPPITPIAGSVPSIAPAVSVGSLSTDNRSANERGNYFWRGAPLAATVGIGLVFMLWAANWSAARRNDPLSILPMVPESVAAAPQSVPSVLPASALQPPSIAAREPGSLLPDDSGAQQSGRPVTSVAPGTSTRPVVRRVPAPVARTTTAVQPQPVQAQPVLPRQAAPAGAVAPLAPSSVAPAPAPSTDMRLPSPNIPAAVPAPVVPTVPLQQGAMVPDSSGATESGASTSGAPLNPVYGGGRGYINIRTGRPLTSTAPVRPSIQANTSERNGANAARNGQTDRAVADATSAIQQSDPGDSDRGWRYQNRALLFLERGDYGRAADDFTSAISAYQDQIGRGVQADEARTGLAACRRGLRLALSRQGR